MCFEVYSTSLGFKGKKYESQREQVAPGAEILRYKWCSDPAPFHFDKRERALHITYGICIFGVRLHSWTQPAVDITPGC